MSYNLSAAAPPRILAALVVVLLLLTPAVAQQFDDPQHDKQIWPDTQVAIKLRPDLRLVFYGTLRIGRDNSAIISERIGLGLRKEFGTHLSGGLYYYYLNSEPKPREHSQEHRVFLDLTPRLPLGENFAVQNRLRIEWREINNHGSWRFRNRLELERVFAVGARQIAAYVAGEPQYDTRSRAWSRTQAYLGARLPLNKHVTLDGFYMRQWDARAKPGFLHVIGVYWRLEF